MEEESIIVDELTSFAFNIKKGICVMLESFLYFLKKFEEKKAHKMIFLMLNLRFKSFCLTSSFVGKEQGVAIVEKYDRKSLYAMLLKCHHPLVETQSSFANIGVDED
jgi:hypothetical protein